MTSDHDYEIINNTRYIRQHVIVIMPSSNLGQEVICLYVTCHSYNIICKLPEMHILYDSDIIYGEGRYHQGGYICNTL